MLTYRNLAYLFLLLAVPPSTCFAQTQFEEGDWMAWGDARDVHNIVIGRQEVFFATGAGVHRLDRDTYQWLYPWFSVPGHLGRNYLLTDCYNVLEDPLTSDLYVFTTHGWFKRENSSALWDSIAVPDESLMARIGQSKPVQAKPEQGMILPHGYSITPKRALKYKFEEWEFEFGAEDERGLMVFAWKGFGFGVCDKYTQRIELYPGGPGPAMGLAVDYDNVWVANHLTNDRGWVWKRPREGNAWQFLAPGIEYGLEPGEVTQLELGPDGTVWIATSEGVMYYRNDEWRHVTRKQGLPRNRIRDIAVVGPNAWVATENGLSMIGSESFIAFNPDATLYPVPANSPFTQVHADGDTVWAATIGALWRLDPDGSWVARQTPLSVASTSAPTALYVEDGWMAIADYTGFAWKQKGDRDWQTLPADMYRNGSVYSIERFGGFWWLGTDMGLVKFQPEPFKVVRYSRKEGLPGRIVFDIMPEGDWVWLGTDLALVRFFWNAPNRMD